MFILAATLDDILLHTVPHRSREALVLLFLGCDTPRRSDAYKCKVGAAEEYGHESDASSVEDDKVDDDGRSDEDEEGDRNRGMDEWPVA